MLGFYLPYLAYLGDTPPSLSRLSGVSRRYAPVFISPIGLIGLIQMVLIQIRLGLIQMVYIQTLFIQTMPKRGFICVWLNSDACAANSDGFGANSDASMFNFNSDPCP